MRDLRKREGGGGRMEDYFILQLIGIPPVPILFSLFLLRLISFEGIRQKTNFSFLRGITGNAIIKCDNRFVGGRIGCQAHHLNHFYFSTFCSVTLYFSTYIFAASSPDVL